MNNKAPSSKLRKFTWKELSLLKDRWNAHVAYEGKVYDVSSYISRHPGGTEQILSGAGRDITQVFKSYHKTDTFQRVLSKYCVGELIDNELPVFTRQSKFQGLLRQRINKYLKEHNLDPKSDYRMFLAYFIIVFLYFLALYLLVYHHYNLFYSFVFSTFRGLLSTLVGGTLHHDSSHFAITHKPWVWKVFNLCAACLIGLSSYVWHYQHIIGHHSYTNIEGADPDIDMGTKEKSGVYKIKESQHWSKYFSYQHLYMPFLYCLQTVRMKISDFHFVLSLRNENIRMNPLSPLQWIEFWIGKLGHILITFIIPLCFMPFSRVVLFYLVFEVTCSLSFTLLVQLNHVSDEVAWPKPDESNNEVNHDWAELQVATAQDYCTDSLFWTIITCALNHQTAHHLFPGFIQSHYRWITPIVKQTCTELNIKYNSVDSIQESLGLHFAFLKRMGSKT